MSNKMLIDATHPEETRVVVLRGNRVEEFDFEAANRKQLRGNIYLAKVTRVEPSLQAAFVDYGGNRHGFLAFSEIHPDYYQIPVADRQALLEEQKRLREIDDDFDPADDDTDDAELQEIEDVDDDVFEEVSDERDPDDSDDDEDDDDTASAEADTETVAEDADTETAEENDAEDGEDTPPRDVPDRFLSASSDDDAVISGDVPAAPVKKTEEDDAGAPAAEETSDAVEASQPDSDSVPEKAAAPAEPASAETTSEPLTEAADTEAAPEPAETIDASEEVIADDADAASVQESTSAAEAGDETDTASTDQADAVDAAEETGSDAVEAAQDEPAANAADGEENAEAAGETTARKGGTRRGRKRGGRGRKSDDDAQAAESSPPQSRRRYKIQEVIKRRQILLVQVVKEERGTKGAALTTYLSLAGRYSVLMPNSARGGGISRKITNPGDRKRLKQIAGDLPVPEGMGVILRTAGASRTKTEIKRDFEYLMRLWENVRDLTLKSSAPTLVYEEGNLVKKSIRDLYNKDIDEVLVSGDTGYREAKDFMRMLMPSHAKNVQPYKERVPIFARHRVEQQLDAMFFPQVTLPSGGYVVINQTEALVAVDVNSGKATREHSIEDTALRTNVEAAEEIARQLRLRDLAGLIVIDFIDMEEKRNNRTVERKLKDCLKTDRARIQVGRISHFGLLEMSRQRLRTGVLESSTELCPHCHGTGVIRSTESVALHVLRTIEDNLLRSASHNLSVRIRTDVALYIINNKRYTLSDIEERYGIALDLVADETIEEAHCIIDKNGIAEARRQQQDETTADTIVNPESIEPEDVQDEEDEDGGRKKRRRRRRRRGRDSDGERSERPADSDGEADSDADAGSDEDAVSEASDEDGDSREDGGSRKRRRGRRGGRRNRRSASADGAEAGEEATENEAEEAVAEAGDEATASEPVTNDGQDASEAGSDEPVADVSDQQEGNAETIEVVEESPEPVVETAAPDDEAPIESAEPEAVMASNTPVQSDIVDAPQQDALPEAVTAPEAEAPVLVEEVETPTADVPPMEPEENRPKRSGWWQRRSFFGQSR